MDFHHKKIAIFGAAREGKATLAYLLQHYPDAQITILDDNDVSIENPGNATVRVGTAMPTTLEDFDIVAVSHGISPSHPLLATARATIAPAQIFLDDCVGTVIGITGTKGKSTTSSLLHHILMTAGKQSFLVGNIGTAVLSVLLTNNRPTDIFVFEISSYMTCSLTTGPQISVILNLGQSHLTYHGGLDAYHRDKVHLAEVQTADDLLVYFAEDKKLVNLIQKTPPRKIPFPDSGHAHVANGMIMIGNQSIIAARDIPLLGEHNVRNVLAAVTVAAELGVDVQHMATAIRTFQALPHRLERVREVNGLLFVDDAISGTPESAIASLRSFDRVGTVILGGTEEGYDFSELVATLEELQVPNVVLMPDSGAQIRTALEQCGYTPNILETRSLEEAVQFAVSNSPKSSVVLLSGASPSYSLFRNFEEKGDLFQSIVNAL